MKKTTDEAKKNNIRNRAIDYTKRTSINFIGVKKDRNPEQKQRIYDIENLTFSQSYNEVKQHDYEIEEFKNQESNTALNYAFSFSAKTN